MGSETAAGRCVVADYSDSAAKNTDGNGDSSKKEEPTFLEQSSPNDRVWDRHRSAVDSVQEVYARAGEEFERYAQRLGECAGRLIFGWAVGALQKLVLISAHFCRVPRCPVCQWRRSLMWIARFHQKLPELLADKKYKNARYLFLTLTVKNCHITELSETIKHMNSSWHRVINDRTLKKFLIGYVRTTEVTRGKDFDMNAHPHFHVLIMVKDSYFRGHYMEQSEWAEFWKMAARLDYTPIADIRAIPNPKGVTQERKISLIMEALKEVLKYAVKPSDMIGNNNKSDSDSCDSDNNSDEWFLELTRQLFRKRLIATGGAFKSFLRENDESDEGLLLQEGESQKDLEAVAMAYDWTKPVKKYVRNRSGDRPISDFLRVKKS